MLAWSSMEKTSFTVSWLVLNLLIVVDKMKISGVVGVSVDLMV